MPKIPTLEEPVSRNAEYVGMLETPFDEPEEGVDDLSPDTGDDEIDLGLPPPGRVDGRTNAGKKATALRAREGLAPDGHPHTPQPPGKTFTYDAAKPERNTSRWFEYMRDLCTHHRYALPRITVYVYRKWPVVDLPHGSRSLKIMGEDWDLFSSDDVMRRFGSGMYRVMVNDQLVKQTDNKTNTICNAMIDCRDMDNFPPIIDNMATAVNWADPANKTYIEYLVRSRVQVKGSGVPALETIPGNNNGGNNPYGDEEGEEDMAAVVEKMFDKVMEQNERLMDKADQPAVPVAVPVPVAPSSDAIAPLTNAFVELVKNQSNNGLRMSDVMEVLRTVHPPQQDNMAPVIDMLTKQMMAAQEQSNKLMLMLLAPKPEPAPAPAQAAVTVTPQSALKDALSITQTIKDAVAEYAGSEVGNAAAPAGGPWAAVINAAVANLPAVLGLLTRLVSMPQQVPGQIPGGGMQGAPGMHGGMYGPVPEPDQPNPYYTNLPPQVIPGQVVQMPTGTAPGTSQGVQGGPVVQMPPQGFPVPQGPPQAPYPTHQQYPPQNQTQPLNQNQNTGGQDPMFMRAVIMQAMDQFGPVILRSIMAGTHGSDFAEEVRRDAGEDGYRTITSLGVEGVMGILAEHPSTSGAVAADPGSVREFVDQFCHPEKYPDEGGDGVGGTETAPAPTPAALPTPLPPAS
jgi:hypothetical protein